MKRLLLIAACLAFLAGCTKEDNVVRQKANLATKATQAHLNIQFMSFGNTLNFYIPEWDRYELTRVAITLYNVYIWPGAESPPIFNTSTWQYVTSQVIIAEASLSENALIHLTPESYMDANSVNIRSNGNYSFAWTVTGINTGYNYANLTQLFPVNTSQMVKSPCCQLSTFQICYLYIYP